MPVVVLGVRVFSPPPSGQKKLQVLPSISHQPYSTSRFPLSAPQLWVNWQLFIFKKSLHTYIQYICTLSCAYYNPTRACFLDTPTNSHYTINNKWGSVFPESDPCAHHELTDIHQLQFSRLDLLFHLGEQALCMLTSSDYT